MSIEIRKPVVTRKTMSVKFRKPGLHASKCVVCGKVYKMGGEMPVGGELPLRSFAVADCGILHGTFDQSANDANGRGLGAQKVIDGGWQTMKEYRPFVAVKARIARCALEIHSAVMTEADLVAEWEKEEPRVDATQEPPDVTAKMAGAALARVTAVY